MRGAPSARVARERRRRENAWLSSTKNASAPIVTAADRRAFGVLSGRRALDVSDSDDDSPSTRGTRAMLAAELARLGGTARSPAGRAASEASELLAESQRLAKQLASPAAPPKPPSPLSARDIPAGETAELQTQGVELQTATWSARLETMEAARVEAEAEAAAWKTATLEAEAKAEAWREASLAAQDAAAAAAEAAAEAVDEEMGAAYSTETSALQQEADRRDAEIMTLTAEAERLRAEVVRLSAACEAATALATDERSARLQMEAAKRNAETEQQGSEARSRSAAEAAAARIAALEAEMQRAALRAAARTAALEAEHAAASREASANRDAEEGLRAELSSAREAVARHEEAAARAKIEGQIASEQQSRSHAALQQEAKECLARCEAEAARAKMEKQRADTLEAELAACREQSAAEVCAAAKSAREVAMADAQTELRALSIQVESLTAICMRLEDSSAPAVSGPGPGPGEIASSAVDGALQRRMVGAGARLYREGLGFAAIRTALITEHGDRAWKAAEPELREVTCVSSRQETSHQEPGRAYAQPLTSEPPPARHVLEWADKSAELQRQFKGSVAPPQILDTLKRTQGDPAQSLFCPVFNSFSPSCRDGSNEPHAGIIAEKPW